MLIALVVVLVGLQVHTAWPRLTTDPYPNRQAARIFDAVLARGGIPCAIDTYTGQRMVGYKTRYGIPRSEHQAEQCTVAFRIGRSGPLDRTFDRVFPYRVKMNAETPGVLWSPVPVACWTAKVPPSGCEVPNRSR